MTFSTIWNFIGLLKYSLWEMHYPLWTINYYCGTRCLVIILSLAEIHKTVPNVSFAFGWYMSIQNTLVGLYKLWKVTPRSTSVHPTTHTTYNSYRLINGSQLAKIKKVDKIYREEAVGLKKSNYTLKITIFVNMWNLEQFRENLIFSQSLVN